MCIKTMKKLFSLLLIFLIAFVSCEKESIEYNYMETEQFRKQESLAIVFLKGDFNRGPVLPLDVSCSSQKANQVVWLGDDGNYYHTYQDPDNHSNYITQQLNDWGHMQMVCLTMGTFISPPN